MPHKIAIGYDHAGSILKQPLIDFLTKNNYEIIDFSTNDHQTATDYPDFAQLVSNAILEQKADYGILICGTGIGMSISANRFPNIRAALCDEQKLATLAREHNNANILCLGARIIAPTKAV